MAYASSNARARLQAQNTAEAAKATHSGAAAAWHASASQSSNKICQQQQHMRVALVHNNGAHLVSPPPRQSGKRPTSMEGRPSQPAGAYGGKYTAGGRFSRPSRAFSGFARACNSEQRQPPQRSLQSAQLLIFRKTTEGTHVHLALVQIGLPHQLLAAFVELCKEQPVKRRGTAGQENKLRTVLRRSLKTDVEFRYSEHVKHTLFLTRRSPCTRSGFGAPAAACAKDAARAVRCESSSMNAEPGLGVRLSSLLSARASWDAN